MPRERFGVTSPSGITRDDLIVAGLIAAETESSESTTQKYYKLAARREYIMELNGYADLKGWNRANSFIDFFAAAMYSWQLRGWIHYNAK